jgi:hypothetical protein
MAMPRVRLFSFWFYDAKLFIGPPINEIRVPCMQMALKHLLGVNWNDFLAVTKDRYVHPVALFCASWWCQPTR